MIFLKSQISTRFQKKSWSFKKCQTFVELECELNSPNFKFPKTLHCPIFDISTTQRIQGKEWRAASNICSGSVLVLWNFNIWFVATTNFIFDSRRKSKLSSSFIKSGAPLGPLWGQGLRPCPQTPNPQTPGGGEKEITFKYVLWITISGISNSKFNN